MMTAVIIYHNVQHECRDCGQLVTAVGGGEWAHLRDDAGHVPVRVAASGRGGWRPSHAMVPVFRAVLPGGPDPGTAARRMFGALGARDLFSEPLGPEDEGLAAAYQARKLRPVEVGDVAVASRTLFAVAGRGLRPVTGDVLLSWAGCRGTVALPHCSHCLVIAEPGELKPFDRAGNQACRDTAACSVRMSAAP